MSWDATPPANSAAAHANAASTEPHEDAFGASTILDAAHTAQWLAHHNGFHFI
jgi:malate/lactate dehydrogenase